MKGVNTNKKIPAPGKKWAEAKASQISNVMYDIIVSLDRAELEALILTCKQFTHTNVGWIAFNAAPGIIELAESRLRDITPISQQK